MNIHKESTETGTRAPAAAGRFYPADPDRLRRQVEGYLAAAPPPETPARAVIAPHAGYRCSGAIAARALAALGATEEDHLLFLLGPAHYRPVRGAGLPTASAFATPLGNVPVATEIADRLAARGAPYAHTPDAHRPEHSLEVMLPFLQLLRPHARIVPLLLDDWAEPETVAADLARLLQASAGARLVISSDLSHYLPYNEATVRDDAFLRNVIAGKTEQVESVDACGRLGIAVGIYLAQQLEWQPELLAYCNSGDTCGSRSEVVGYAALAYLEKS